MINRTSSKFYTAVLQNILLKNETVSHKLTENVHFMGVYVCVCVLRVYISQRNYVHNKELSQLYNEKTNKPVKQRQKNQTYTSQKRTYKWPVCA